MDTNLLSIGKMAEMNRLSVATLRLYDELGLLKPRCKDPETGYRYYDIAQNARLDMIAYMKELGMSLAEIGEVLRQEDITRIETLLAEKNEQLHRQIRALHAPPQRGGAGHRLDRTVSKIALRGARSRWSTSTRRYLWGLPCRTQLLSKQDIRAFERGAAGCCGRRCLDSGFTQPHSYNVGTSIAQRGFHRRALHRQGHVRVHRLPRKGSAVSGVTADRQRHVRLRLPGQLRRGNRLCRSACWPHCRGERTGTMCGDYLCEVMTEFNVFDSDQPEHVPAASGAR